MTELGKHFRQVAHEGAGCASDHADDFEGLIANYHEAEDYLAAELATDITPERIFMGGNIDPIGTLYIDLDEGEQEAPYGSVERWAVDDPDTVLVSKRAGLPSSLVLGFIENRRQFIRNGAQKRIKKITDLVLAADCMWIKVFETPETINDEVLSKMRAASYKSSRDDKLDAVSPKDVMYTGEAIRNGMLPEALVTILEDEVALLAFFGMSRSDRAQVPPIERQIRMEQSRQFLIHDGGEDLLVATTGLQHAAKVVRNGRLVTPTAPQHAVIRWGDAFFRSPLERRLLEA